MRVAEAAAVQRGEKAAASRVSPRYVHGAEIREEGLLQLCANVRAELDRRGTPLYCLAALSSGEEGGIGHYVMFKSVENPPGEPFVMYMNDRVTLGGVCILPSWDAAFSFIASNLFLVQG